APRYPELVVVARRQTLEDDPALVRGFTKALNLGSSLAASEPEKALGDLIDANPDLDRDSQAAQQAVLRDSYDSVLRPRDLIAWSKWAAMHGITKTPVNVAEAFPLSAQKGVLPEGNP